MSFIPSVYSVENITKGHPDRVCDRIADAILHAYEQADPHARVAIEVLGTAGLLLITGEVSCVILSEPCLPAGRESSTSRGIPNLDPASIALTILKDLGYDTQVKIDVRLNTQSTQIAQAADHGAGDQGIMYGYASDETPEFFPLGVALTRRLVARLEQARESGEILWLLPDGKVQVTIRHGVVDTIILSTQHKEGVSLDEVRRVVQEKVIIPILSSLRGGVIDDEAIPRTLINSSGLWTIGGFIADTGLTGRKLSCDTYGGLIPNGGGSTHGKDMTKVDRSASLVAREVAIEIIKSGKARECLISVAYAIGIDEPIMFEVMNERGESIKDLVDIKRFGVGEMRGKCLIKE